MICLRNYKIFQSYRIYFDNYILFFYIGNLTGNHWLINQNPIWLWICEILSPPLPHTNTTTWGHNYTPLTIATFYFKLTRSFTFWLGNNINGSNSYIFSQLLIQSRVLSSHRTIDFIGYSSYLKHLIIAFSSL